MAEPCEICGGQPDDKLHGLPRHEYRSAPWHARLVGRLLFEELRMPRRRPKPAQDVPAVPEALYWDQL
jgi:hypothetical protein